MVFGQCHLALYYAEIAQHFDGLPAIEASRRLQGFTDVLFS
jgi:hypothetical protein